MGREPEAIPAGDARQCPLQLDSLRVEARPCHVLLSLWIDPQARAVLYIRKQERQCGGA